MDMPTPSKVLWAYYLRFHLNITNQLPYQNAIIYRTILSFNVNDSDGTK